MLLFTVRPHYQPKGKRYYATVHAHGFSYTTRNYRKADGARQEALRAIRQLHVIKGLHDNGSKVVTAIGESIFDDNRAFRETKPKRQRV